MVKNYAENSNIGVNLLNESNNVDYSSNQNIHLSMNSTLELSDLDNNVNIYLQSKRNSVSMNLSGIFH